MRKALESWKVSKLFYIFYYMPLLLFVKTIYNLIYTFSLLVISALKIISLCPYILQEVPNKNLNLLCC